MLGKIVSEFALVVEISDILTVAREVGKASWSTTSFRWIDHRTACRRRIEIYYLAMLSLQYGLSGITFLLYLFTSL